MTDSWHQQSRVGTIIPREHLASVFCVLLCAAFSIPKVMSTLAPYDDEGYVMLTLQSFQDGDRLYSQIHTQYGPVFYYLSGCLHEYLHIPLTQDGVRWKTIAIWALSSLLCLFILKRLGLSSDWALIGAGVFHLHLDKLALEPGHPQELVLLLGLLSLWTLSGENPLRWHMASIYVAFIGLIKINCGVLFGLPLLMSAFLTNEGPNQKISSGSSWIGRCLAFQSQAAFKSVVLMGLGTSLLILFSVNATGVSWREIAWGLVGQHQRFGGTFFHMPPIEPWAIGLSAVGMLFVVAGVRPWNRQHSNRFTGQFVIGGIACLGGVLLAIDSLRPLQHGLEPRGAGGWLVCSVPVLSVLSWRYLRNGQAAVRYLHGLVWFAPFMAYPTPGTQLSIGTSFVWMQVFLVAKELYQPFASTERNIDRIRVSSPALWGGVSMMVFASLMLWKEWVYLSPLRGDGASWLRVNKQLADRESRLVEAIQRTGCRRLAFDGHSHGRFLLWSGLKPLTSANPTFWPRMLSSVEQSRWFIALEREPVCVVLPPERELLAGGQCQALRDAMLERWVPIESIDGWHVGIRYPTSEANRLPHEPPSTATFVNGSVGRE